MARSRWCGTCRRQVLAQYQYPNFVLHALLTVATCGLWFPVLFIKSSQSRYNCPMCGYRV